MTNYRTDVMGILMVFLFTAAADTDDFRPYEFSFNIEDFQHRYEKKDSAGIVTGEYGFITADGVYHETAYATDEHGHFIITKMKNRKITSLQIAQEIFKGKPEVAKRVIEVLAKSCSGCGIPVQKPPAIEASSSNVQSLGTDHKKELEPSSLIKNGQPPPTTTSKSSILNAVSNAPDPKIPPFDNQIVGNFSNDFHYHFNYTITSHGHEETGYHDGNKNGSYRTLGLNGTDANVKYISNEFGHQPNITFVNRQHIDDSKESLAGFAFKWIFQRR